MIPVTKAAIRGFAGQRLGIAVDNFEVVGVFFSACILHPRFPFSNTVGRIAVPQLSAPFLQGFASW
jgi:hypothetical protein